MIEKYLDDLENRINPAVEEELLFQWRQFLSGDFTGDIFSPRRGMVSPSALEWPCVGINEAINDFEKMALHQLSGCSRILAEGTGSLMGVRANYGTGIVSSFFGAEIFLMSDDSNTLPTTKPLNGGIKAIESLLDQGIPDLRCGYGKKVLDMGHYYRGIFKAYPKISKFVSVYHPDLQGPMDNCELLWGSDLFLDIVDHPELVRDFLELITQTYIHFMNKWNQIIPPQNGYAVHWSMLHKGTIMLRNDSAMNFSPAIFEAFIEPSDQRIFNELGGGAVHFCGRGDHYISRMSHIKGVYAVNLSQPQCNDMEIIYRNTIDKGIKLIGFDRQFAESALSQGRKLRGNVHCV